MKRRAMELQADRVESTTAIQVNLPQLKKHKAFLAWLNKRSTVCFTWHRKGHPIDEYSDVIVHLDTDGEGSDSDMPVDVWQYLVKVMDGRCGLVWITFLE